MKFKLICICGILLMSISCNKYLDKKSNTSLLIPASLKDAQALLDAYQEMNSVHTPSFGEVSANDYFLKREIYNGMTLQDQHNYTWRYYFPGSRTDWEQGYRGIYMSNLCLEILKKISRNKNNATSWDQVCGSALFYRSYNFLMLLWNFAKAYDSQTADEDLGIALRQTSDFNIPSTRSTNQASYDQVIEDTKASIQLLPDYPILATRPSKCAAYGLLARCFLTMREYEKALLYSDSALQLNSALMNLNDDEDIPLGLNATYPFKRFNKETIFYTEMDGSPSFFKSASKSRMDSFLVSTYDKNDLRKTAYFTGKGDGFYQFKGSYSGSTACFSGISVDEMYLIRAECYVRTGEAAKGLEDLNKLLRTRYKTNTFSPYINESESQALEVVLLERRKELTMRGLRWIDIKRLNKEGANITLKRVEDDGIYTLLPNANYYAVQLPDDIIELTGMPQNPL